MRCDGVEPGTVLVTLVRWLRKGRKENEDHDEEHKGESEDPGTSVVGALAFLVPPLDPALRSKGGRAKLGEIGPRLPIINGR